MIGGTHIAPPQLLKGTVGVIFHEDLIMNPKRPTVAVLTYRGGKLTLRVLSGNPNTRWTLP